MYRQRGEVVKWILIIVGVGVLGWFYWQNQERGNSEDWMEMVEVQPIEVKEESSEEKLVVHAAGAVKQPGVYVLSSYSRVVDLIKAAGGVLGTADLNQINLAAPLVDGQKLIVPERVFLDNSVGIRGGSISINSSGMSSGKVSINNGSKEDLMSLSGIGTSKADAIILYREENGPFRKLEDLVKVQGIGEKTFEMLKSQISLY